MYVEETALFVVYAPHDPPWPYWALLSDNCYMVTKQQYSARYGAYTHPRRVKTGDADVDDVEDVKYFCFHPCKVTVWIDEVVGYQTCYCAPGESVDVLYATGCAYKIPLHVLRRLGQ